MRCNSFLLPGVFCGGEIEPGTFHGGEIEAGTFHLFCPDWSQDLVKYMKEKRREAVATDPPAARPVPESPHPPLREAAPKPRQLVTA